MRSKRLCRNAGQKLACRRSSEVVTIYPEYGDEPKDAFLTLPEDLACHFYTLEMDDFVADINFFNRLLPQRGRILELGCGNGRVMTRLARRERPATGIDRSLPMLRRASQKRHDHCTFLCMDMTELSLATTFDHILVAYNTLNLLCSQRDIMKCLRGCRKILHPAGTLLVQLFVPTSKFLRANKKTFQFQIFNRPDGGKIIKEIIKNYVPHSRTVCIEERFRVRPMKEGETNQDYRSIYHIAGFSASAWAAFFTAAGFTLTDAYGDYLCRPFDGTTSSLLLASLSCKNS